MNDIEMRRLILQYAYEHRHEHSALIVGVEDMDFLKDKDQNRIFQNLNFLNDQRLIKVWDGAWELILITTPGIILIENRVELERRFPIKYNMPKQTKEMIDTIEELLKDKYNIPLQQFVKARKFLFESKPPDYLNCIKEAVLTVEGVVKILLNEPRGTLKELLPTLKQKHLAHPAMAKILDGVYAVRGDEPNIVHAGIGKSDFGYAEAEFMLNTCASIIIYLVRE